MVKFASVVENLFMAISMVTPRLRSSVPWSITHAKANDALPIASASLRCLSIVLWSITPVSSNNRPIKVLLPAST